MKKIIKLFFQYLKWKFYAPFKINDFPCYESTHSQFGEDAFISKIFSKNSGFYIDIGAHHPVFMSNTYHFYKKGWSGINIDAHRGSMDLFKWMRPRDVNLECLVVGDEDHDKEQTFYSFKASSLNSTGLEIANQLQMNWEKKKS